MSEEKVKCVVLKEESEAMESAPYPGALGLRVLANVSKEGWRKWLERLTAIMNENGLNTADVDTLELIEKHMKGFLFGEGNYGQLPPGYHAAGAKGGAKK